MNRFKFPQPYISGLSQILSWSDGNTPLPTAVEMEAFASQFSEKEWKCLCQDPHFLLAVDSEMEDARTIAESVLKRRVSLRVKLLKV